MGTEYRHGIPSVAHIEAATRLGLDWHRLEGRTWRFEMRNGEIFGDSNPHRTYLPYLQSAVGWQNSQLRPIRTDGTTVDWGVLDAEVARVQRGPQCEDCEGTGRVYGATHDGSRTCSECNGRGYALRPEAVAQPAQPQPRPTVQTQPAQPEVRRHGGIEPRRFADVRPDRHGWRWWRECTRSGSLSERFETRDGRCRWMSAHSEAWFDDRQNPGLYRRTVIPTDEQGNPVFWESIAQPATVAHQHEWVYDGLGGGHNGQYYHNCACGERDWFAEPIRRAVAPPPTTASTQPQGFRADLWRRMLRSFFGDRLSEVDNGLRLAGITAREHDRMFRFDNGGMLVLSGMSDVGYTDADILARWAVYQELKPLYDIVDGAQGEAPMPEDTILELARRSGWETYPRKATLHRTDEQLQIRETNGWNWSSDDDSTCGNQLCNFAAVLDATLASRLFATVPVNPVMTMS